MEKEVAKSSEDVVQKGDANVAMLLVGVHWRYERLSSRSESKDQRKRETSRRDARTADENEPAGNQVLKRNGQAAKSRAETSAVTVAAVKSLSYGLQALRTMMEQEVNAEGSQRAPEIMSKKSGENRT
ncbi:hypothetical protein P7K49_028372 [Saguinus oedipus]|uniref:Uncharacterized protein n=1 Tax=Saguinus oedipus TaxID=9490 RepID=A0ABQ9UC21_SAGOE|nr:hypothetical protein P7K49_028372 [Saguinus oedipus]